MLPVISPRQVSLDRLPPERNSFTRGFLVLFLALALIVTFTCREAFFTAPTYEEGDDASNHLQIERAKHFDELHGNYSRWGFHHPGPAFFYAYAAGERVLCDAMGLTPTPHNAHIYTGTLLQLAFYAAAIALLARYSRQPLLAMALALAIGAWHYAHVDRAIYSVWPPDALLMPFLCFVTACAATATGDLVAWPILIFSSGFLVHGHIAQPLFVGPMGLVALVLGYRNQRDNLRALARKPAVVASLAIGAVFLLPMVLDLFAGRGSNAHDVLLHLRYQTDGGRSLFKSFLCYASYFVGMNDPTMFNRLDDTSHVPFVEHAGLLAAWLVTIIGSAWWCFRAFRDKSSDDLRFGRHLVVFWAAASLLTLVWGMRQDGGFTNFNSHFNHSLVHIIAFAGIVTVTNVLPRTSAPFGWCMVLAALPLLTLTTPCLPEIGTRGNEVAARVRGLLDSDPNPAAPKLITWEIPDADWYEAVTLARAFQRLGISWYVSPRWAFMFGNDVVFADQASALGRSGLSEWHVVQRKDAPAGAHVLNHDYAVVFRRAAHLPSLPLNLAFTNNAHLWYAVFGVNDSESGIAWTDANVAAFSFTAPDSSSDLELTVDADGFVAPRAPAVQHLVVTVNGQTIGKAEFTAARQTVRFPVPASTWNSRQPRMIVLQLPDATSPARIGQSPDRRLLGLRLHHLTVGPRSPESPVHPDGVPIR